MQLLRIINGSYSHMFRKIVDYFKSWATSPIEEKVKINITTLGYLPFRQEFDTIKHMVSDLFEHETLLKESLITIPSDLNDWGYSDNLIKKLVSNNSPETIQFYITFLSLEDSYFMRIFKGNIIVISYSDMAATLEHYNIPLVNLTKRLIYSLVIQYRINEKKIETDLNKMLFHDETRGCIFDLNPRKYDISYSCDKPIICNSCQEKILESGKICNKQLDCIKSEIKSIKKTIYYKYTDFLKKHVYLSIFLSIIFGIIVSILTNIIWEIWLKNFFI